MDNQPTVQVSSPNPPVPPASPLPPKNYLLFILLGLIILIFIFCSLFLVKSIYIGKPHIVPVTPFPQVTITPSPTANPTADWKTYKNTKFGFTLQYPKSWRVIDYTENRDNNHEVLFMGDENSQQQLRILI